MAEMSKKQKENLVKYLGIEHLSEKERLEIVDEVAYTLNMHVMNKAYDQLTKEQREEINPYFEAEEEEKVMAYLNQNVPNFQEMIQDKLAEIKNTLHQEMERLNKTKK